MQKARLFRFLVAFGIMLSVIGCSFLQKQETKDAAKDVLAFTEVLCVLGHAEKSEPKLIAQACGIRDALVPLIERTLLEHKAAGMREAALKASASASSPRAPASAPPAASSR